MKILVVPDSFKGTLTSKQACDCIKKGIKSVDENTEVLTIPFSDGGEGFLSCYNNICKGELLYTSCTDIYSRNMTGRILRRGNTAVIECACAGGIQVKKDVMNATSYGTGELIKFAVNQGFSNIILGLGGSGSCDGGAGIIEALGGRFYNKDGDIIHRPCGKLLNEINHIDLSDIVKGINFTFACDVSNHLYGKNGAAYVFAKQKGATDSEIKILDDGLRKLNSLLPKDVSRLDGGGAAGGICAGLYSIYTGEIKSGFDILAELSRLEEKIRDADLIVTGEGKTDSQTEMGKLPYKIYRLCEKYNKKCVLISGSIEGRTVFHKTISLTDDEITLEYAVNNAEKVLTDKSKYILQ